MAQEFSRSLLRVSVAQICQSLGWNAVQSTPMELLTDVMERYLLEVGNSTQRYTEQFGRTVPNLDDVGLAFQDLGIKLSELEDYVQHVDPVPFALEVPKFPAPRESLLHFPKPNSRELLSRDEHVPDYLPPMHPDAEEETVDKPSTPTNHHAAADDSTNISPAPGSDKRPASSVLEAVPTKRAKNLPDDIVHSQYTMKHVWMSNSGLPEGTQGTLPDARTPPPPTPQPQKTVVVPFPGIAATEDKPSTTDTPSQSKPSVVSETVEIRSNVGVESLPSFRVENIDKMPQPKSPWSMSKTNLKSPKGRSPKAPKKSPKGSPISPKGRPPKVIGLSASTDTPGKTVVLKTAKVVKSPKIKKVKPPKPMKSPKPQVLSSPARGKSPKKGKNTEVTPKLHKVANVVKSTVPSVTSVISDSVPVTDKPSVPAVQSDVKPDLPSLLGSMSPPTTQAMDLSVPKFTVRTKAAMKQMDPSLTMIKQEYSVEIPDEAPQAKESRLASYDDVINSVAMESKQPVASSTNKSEASQPSTPVKQEKGSKAHKLEKKQKRLKLDAASDDMADTFISDEPTVTVTDVKPEVSIVTTASLDSIDSRLPFSSDPSQFPSPVSSAKLKKEKSAKKDKKLVIKIPEAASTPSGEDSDASRASRPRARECSFSPASPKVLLEQMTPEDIRRFSYSPEKKITASPSLESVTEEGLEPVPKQEPIQPIKLDLSQTKISIKVPKDESKSDKDGKKDKKKKKNKDKDRERSKDKKDKHRDKEKKKDRKDKEKRKHEEESTTTVGGPGIKLTLKFGGLKTATPTMSVTEKEQSPKQESLKMVIKSSKSAKSSKHKIKAASPSLPPDLSPAHSPARPPSPCAMPSPIPTRSPSPLKRERSPSPAPLASTHLSPSQSRSQSPMPVLQHHSPLMDPVTFSPLPSPAPVIELPLSRTPSPCPPQYPSPHVSRPPPDDSEDDRDNAGETSSTRGITTETLGTIKDEDGQTIWICPACKMQDDGSPMIGCDNCDDWYHWPCVGIKREPPEHQEWFCPRCSKLPGKQDKKRKPVKAKPGRKKTKKK